jgi:hypothetical protein
MFFKLVLQDKDDPRPIWTLYHTIDDMRGNIYFIRGNVRIQVITDDMIYFYMIDKISMVPTLENVMANPPYMSCSQLMFGARVRFGVSFKVDQPGFTIFTRKYFHNFKVQLDTENYEGALGVNLSKHKKYVMAIR